MLRSLLFIFWFVLFLYLLETAHSLSTHSPIVGCWDGVLDSHSLSTLCQAGATRSHSFTSIMDNRAAPRSIIESVIKSILREMNTDDPFVEYWYKTGARMLEAHRDIDETLCRMVQVPIALGSNDKIGKQVCPSFGHVLYLKIENICAPTLVWQEASTGSGPPRQLTQLWSVPARSNRLLRFQGDSLHAVSYPALGFLGVEKDETPSSQYQCRSVLLFNTWKRPPLYPAVATPLSKAENELLSINNSFPTCLPRSLWKSSAVYHSVTKNDEELREMTVPLLGEFYRRGIIDPAIRFNVPFKTTVAALSSSDDLFRLDLQ